MSEPFAKRGKRLSSAAKQLRGWVGSDPSKEPDFIDALNKLTEHRLLGHAYSEAFSDANEAFKLAYKAAPSPGTLGPLTKTEVIGRQIESMAHLAVVLLAAGQSESAAQTASAALAVRSELGRPELDHRLSPASKVWLLTALARGSAQTGDLARANAFADAALARARDAGFASSSRLAPLAVDTESLVADCRWAVGVSADSIEHTSRALSLQQQLTDAARRQVPPPASAELLRLGIPMVRLRRDLADRLDFSGDLDQALAERRILVERIRTAPGKLIPESKELLCWGLSDLSSALLRRGLTTEARAFATEGFDLAMSLTASESSPGQYLAVQLVAGASAAEAALHCSDAEAAAACLGSVLQRHTQLDAPEPVIAAYGVALLARADVEEAHELNDSADSTRVEFRALARKLMEHAPAGDTFYAGVAVEDFVRDRARSVVTRSSAPTPHWDNLAPVTALAVPATSGSEEAVILVAAPAPEPRLVEQSAIETQPEVVPEPVAEPEPVIEPEQVAEPVVEPEVPESPASDPAAEPRRLLDAGMAAQAEASARDLLQTHRPTLEVVALLRVIADARAQQGDRRGVPAIANQIVEQMRPLAESDPDAHGASLIAALQSLSEARKSAGDWWGSLAPAREAKQLAKRAGR